MFFKFSIFFKKKKARVSISLVDRTHLVTSIHEIWSSIVYEVIRTISFFFHEKILSAQKAPNPNVNNRFLPSYKFLCAEKIVVFIA